MKRILLVALATTLASASVFAASPTGLWQTIDDNTGKPRGLIRITNVNGEYQGTIEKLYQAPDEDQNPKCDKCDGELRNKPVIGMTILTGLRQDGDSYENGKILDPESGNVYSSRASLDETGKKLEVRGYIGVSLIGRSQTWIRAD